MKTYELPAETKAAKGFTHKVIVTHDDLTDTDAGHHSQKQRQRADPAPANQNPKTHYRQRWTEQCLPARFERRGHIERCSDAQSDWG